MGGSLWVWAAQVRCCGGGWRILECGTSDPGSIAFRLLHDADGVRVWAPIGLGEPDELHVELSRRGRIRAYWNGLGWVD
jgi:hypothetical protein